MTTITARAGSDPGVKRRWRGRLASRGDLAAALVGIALTAAACGGGSAAPGVAGVGSTSSTTSPAGTGLQQKALVYASCMRAHGVPNFPDAAISVNGGKVEINVPGAIKGEPQFRSASQACQRDFPGAGISAKPSANTQEELKFAQCMRSHGITAFPDPLPGGGFDIPGDTNSSQYRSANQACESGLHASGS